MPTKEDLLQMDPKDIYGQAVRAGIEVATKDQGLGIEPDALKQWFEKHPEFADSEVRALLHLGAQQDLMEVIKEARQIPGVVGVFNFDGAEREREFFPT